jgi:hypothetical protein
MENRRICGEKFINIVCIKIKTFYKKGILEKFKVNKRL